VKLRGRLTPQAAMKSTEALQARPMRPDWSRGRTLSPGARGAKPQAHHGPLQRLLGIGSAKKAGIAVFLNQSEEFFDGLDFWRRLVAMPLQVLTQPEYSPTVLGSNVGGLCEGVLALSSSGTAPHRPDFIELNALARKAEP
jgi:hypothetical protein